MVCLEINSLGYILQYTIYIFYKLLEYYEISQKDSKIQKICWFGHCPNQQKSGYQSVGFYKSYKIS